MCIIKLESGHCQSVGWNETVKTEILSILLLFSTSPQFSTWAAFSMNSSAAFLNSSFSTFLDSSKDFSSAQAFFTFWTDRAKTCWFSWRKKWEVQWLRRMGWSQLSNLLYFVCFLKNENTGIFYYSDFRANLDDILVRFWVLLEWVDFVRLLLRLLSVITHFLQITLENARLNFQFLFCWHFEVWWK